MKPIIRRTEIVDAVKDKNEIFKANPIKIKITYHFLGILIYESNASQVTTQPVL